MPHVMEHLILQHLLLDFLLLVRVSTLQLLKDFPLHLMLSISVSVVHLMLHLVILHRDTDSDNYRDSHSDSHSDSDMIGHNYLSASSGPSTACSAATCGST